jgi:hypothetical protein
MTRKRPLVVWIMPLFVGLARLNRVSHSPNYAALWTSFSSSAPACASAPPWLDSFWGLCPKTGDMLFGKIHRHSAVGDMRQSRLGQPPTICRKSTKGTAKRYPRRRSRDKILAACLLSAAD